MVRNDGTVFECEDRHLYILKDVNFPMAMNMEAILSNRGKDIIWFAHHTRNKNLIELIRKSLPKTLQKKAVDFSHVMNFAEIF